MLIPKLRSLKMMTKVLLGSAVLLFLVAAFTETVAVQNDALDVEAPLNAKHSQSSILNRIKRSWNSYRNMENCNPHNQIACDGHCISVTSWCDGYQDCFDGSDEEGCYDESTDSTIEATEDNWTMPESTENPEVTEGGFRADAETASAVLTALESINSKLNSTLELSSQIDALSSNMSALFEQVTQLVESNNEVNERHGLLVSTVRLIQKDNMARAKASTTCQQRLKILEGKCGRHYGR